MLHICFDFCPTILSDHYQVDLELLPFIKIYLCHSILRGSDNSFMKHFHLLAEMMTFFLNCVRFLLHQLYFTFQCLYSSPELSTDDISISDIFINFLVFIPSSYRFISLCLQISNLQCSARVTTLLTSMLSFAIINSKSLLMTRQRNNVKPTI